MIFKKSIALLMVIAVTMHGGERYDQKRILSIPAEPPRQTIKDSKENLEMFKDKFIAYWIHAQSDKEFGVVDKNAQGIYRIKRLLRDEGSSSLSQALPLAKGTQIRKITRDESKYLEHRLIREKTTASSAIIKADDFLKIIQNSTSTKSNRSCSLSDICVIF